MAKYRANFLSDDDIWYISPDLGLDQNMLTNFAVSNDATTRDFAVNSTGFSNHGPGFSELPCLMFY